MPDRDPLSELEPILPEGRPASFRLPQIIVEGALKHSARAGGTDMIVFKLRVLRLLELTFLVKLPEKGSTKAPVYVRFWIDRTSEDKPGSGVISSI